MPSLIETHKLAFFGIPKIASTSMKLVLFELQYGKPISDYTPPPGQKLKPLHDHYPSRKLQRNDFERCENYWKFAVVRDPVDRILSAYGHRVVGLGDLEKRSSAKRKARFLRISLRPDLEEFCLRLNRYRFMSRLIRHHVRPQSDFLGHDLSKLDASYPIESMAKLADDLAERTGRPIEIPKNSGVGPRFTRSDMSPKATRAIVRNFAADYNLLRGVYLPPSNSKH